MVFMINRSLYKYDLIKDCLNPKTYKTKEYKAIDSLYVFTTIIKTWIFEKVYLIMIVQMLKIVFDLRDLRFGLRIYCCTLILVFDIWRLVFLTKSR